MALYKTLTNNKNIFLEYNRLRKKIFSQLAPKDSEAIMYLLPWMLSVNHESVPGYIASIKHNFRVFNIETDNEIRKRETLFKKLFKIQTSLPVLKMTSQDLIIEGIYTIGSVGTISQTPSSDCDMWICIHKAEYGDISYAQFLKKVQRIQNWMDANLKMPVHFFVSDIEDIRRCNFGDVDYESCGSTQKKVLKEEFYRTCILIAGKVPLWWVCHDPLSPLNYDEVVKECQSAPSVYYDLIDMGNLDFIDKEESFGAALWQLNKSLTHPLKSIIKMLLLKMFLESPEGDLLCHRFRRQVLKQDQKPYSFVDPSIFTLISVLDHLQNLDAETFKLILQCFYLRYEIKLFSRRVTLKEENTLELFKKYDLDRNTIYELNRFSDWSYSAQVQFGKTIFMFLVKIYKDISEIARNVTGDVAPQDLTILGRKLSSSLKKKSNKIQILLRPLDTHNLPSLTIRAQEGIWQIFPENDFSSIISEKSDLVYCLAHLVWNGLYFPGLIRMLPNTTSTTMPEVINLCKKIKDVFGIYDVSSIEFENFLQPERIKKMLIISNFADDPDVSALATLRILTLNNWGELYIHTFNRSAKIHSFLENISKNPYYVRKYYYIPQNSRHGEKILEETKRLIFQHAVS
ncbi:adenylate cyclase, class 1 [Syntrophus gentianae]|uniref:Adenylate cyclase, class 1 n=1 Tax=Syntrophus gentianae TaxID=43775 RepID=A0A1H7XMR3_9BACT|nr:class I adenylate cyclase [Syntrophus gentianae]SEM35070.1 adenylate cyclase, class 1 [Syntrophus gentianae]